jgi:DNA-binding CsgD family transcriptional regulator
MTNVVETVEKVSEFFGHIECSRQDTAIDGELLQPLAEFLCAETATFRCFSASHSVSEPEDLVSLGIPDSVNDAYLSRYCRLDPARRLIGRRLDQALFAHPTRYGEWSKEHASPAALEQFREEFTRYRREFLVPNHFVHHVGFCFQDLDGRTLLFDFHRKACAPKFSRFEVALTQIVAQCLQARALRCRHVPVPTAGRVDDQLSAREIEVAEAVVLGMSNKEVAASLQISVRTVENHMRSIFSKLRVSTRTRLAAKLREATPRPVAQIDRVA